MQGNRSSNGGPFSNPNARSDESRANYFDRQLYLNTFYTSCIFSYLNHSAGSKNGQFEFTYNNEVHEAIEDGFELLIAFPEIDKLYNSDKLFPVFASRLPDPKRKGIEAILNKYGLAEYDAYKLLKSSGVRLPIDD